MKVKEALINSLRLTNHLAFISMKTIVFPAKSGHLELVSCIYMEISVLQNTLWFFLLVLAYVMRINCFRWLGEN